MLIEKITKLTQNFYIKHNNNVKLVYRETPKGTVILGTYSSKTLFSRNDTNDKSITRTIYNNDEFVSMLLNHSMDIKKVVEDKKYIVVAGIIDNLYVWLKYSCFVEYLICEKFTDALFLESSILASGKEFIPSSINIKQLAETKNNKVRIMNDIVRIIDKRNIFF